MSHVDDVREFLSGRRARVTPEQAGLPAYGGHRRVKGLRREEVAMLAGVSVDYYVRLERGNLSGASDSVLESLARALQLDDVEREYLYDLARQSPAPGPRSRTASPKLRPVVQQVLDAITDAPAWVRNSRHDFLATNRLARALHAPMLEHQPHPANSARFVFLDPAAPGFYREWERVAEDTAGFLRQEAAHAPYDRSLQELIGELSTQSEVFRRNWAQHNVRTHRAGTKKLHHPVVGDLDLNFESAELTSQPGLILVIYTAAPGSSSADALNLLASLAATEPEQSPAR
ncbi:transcriptional regulator [Microlunatus endophyticus]|uniref:Transcriptional regulator n=1 Tax=Microlunatus endophyticus TaxID=1716077 RepID=A0A917W291_9ACTN|nr:helix-turn-helix transcriptional regulator [Microlunatus endophyticus]GGL59577.1 transcriptional regulator [Microlunatus endophyticus]